MSSGIRDNDVLNYIIYPRPRFFTEPGFCTTTTWRQIGYTIVSSLFDISVGMAFAFGDKFNEIQEHIVLSSSDKFWINIAFTLSMAGGSLLSGLVMDNVGRKASIIFTQMPLSIGWLVTGLAATSHDLLVGRIVTGAGCGMSFPVIVYPTEISHPRLRGVVCTFPHIARSLGISIQIGLGLYFTWYFLAVAAGVFNTILCFVYLLLPETPYFLIMKNKVHKAEKVLQKFRRRVSAGEMDELQDYKNTNDIRSLNCQETLAAIMLWAAMKPFLICLGYFVFVQLSGAQLMYTLGQNIILQSKSSITVETAVLTHSIMKLISGFLTAIIIYKVKRKTMAITSAAGVFVTCVVLATFIRSINTNTIYSQLLYGTYVFFSTLGYYTIAYIMMTEIYPLQIRGLLIGITLSLVWILQALCSNILFRELLSLVGLSYMLYFFGFCSGVGAIYCYFFLPETKDLTLQEIEEYFNRRRPTLVSQRRVISEQLLETAETVGLKRIESRSSERLVSRDNSEIRKKKTATWSELLAKAEIPSDEIVAGPSKT